MEITTAKSLAALGTPTQAWDSIKRRERRRCLELA